MTYHRVVNKNNITGVTNVAGHAYTLGTPSVTRILAGVVLLNLEFSL